MANQYLQELIGGYPPILKWSNRELNFDQGPTLLLYTNEGKNCADILLGNNLSIFAYSCSGISASDNETAGQIELSWIQQAVHNFTSVIISNLFEFWF